jgi:hypothetical protein
LEANAWFYDVFEVDAHHAKVVCAAFLRVKGWVCNGSRSSEKTDKQAAQHQSESFGAPSIP